MNAELLTVVASLVTLGTLIVNGAFQAMREKRRDLLSFKNRELDIQERRSNARAATVQVETVASHLATKIDANTDISVRAFDTANNVNEKIAAVAAATKQESVATMSDVLNEVKGLRAATEDLRHLVLDHIKVGHASAAA